VATEETRRIARAYFDAWIAGTGAGVLVSSEIVVAGSGLRHPHVGGMSAKKKSVPEDKLRLYERLVDSVDGAETKSNFGSGYTASTQTCTR
jgi:hypothetical protein